METNVAQNGNNETRHEALEELREIRSTLHEIRDLLDDFAGVLLNAKFPYGQASDRWAHPRRRRAS